MTTKLVKQTDSKATQISTFTINGVEYVNIRQMYKTKKNPNKWMPGRSVSLNIEDDFALSVLRKALKIVKDENTDYPEIEVGKKDDE